MKKRILLIILILVTSYIIINLLNNTYAYSYEIDKTNLFYKDNTKELEKDIEKYISKIDDYIIPNTIFETSNYLDENYDFLIYFATDYILNNYENYIDNIITSNNYEYLNKEMLIKNKYKYIDKNIIYNITDKYFGKKDFYTTNNDINNNQKYISLIDYTDKIFDLNINDVKIINDNNEINAIITYENNIKYKYIFKNTEGILKIKNIEVL